MKTKPLFLLIIVSMAVFCILSCGCTTQDESSQTGDSAVPGQESNPGEKPAGNMTTPEGGGPGGMGNEIDLAAAAETLGVTEEELSAALGVNGEGGQMDFESAAETLGVTVEELQDALGFGDMPERSEGEMPDGTPPGEPPA